VPSSETHALAVLPLENLSGDPDQEYFADGITEDLIGELSKIRNLRVPSRTTVMRYKGTRKSLPAIAHELEVDTVIEGSVRRQGDRVRISVQLLRSRTGEHLWADTYDEHLEDILDLQRTIARAVADHVRVALSPDEAERLRPARRVNPAAYDLYLRAVHRIETRPEIPGAIADLE